MTTTAALLLALAAPQDFATDWLDRVTHEREQTKGPLPVRKVTHTMELGAIAYYDNNIFLEGEREDSNTVVTPFIRGRVEFSDLKMDLAADVLLSYKRYLQDEEESDDEERFWGRIRYVAAGWQAELVQIVRHESDPVDSVFSERVDRVVTDTVPRVEFDFNNLFGLELNADVQWVKFLEELLETSNNVNTRVDLGAVYHGAGGMDFLAQAGVLTITYQDGDGPPDAMGFYARAGFRGDVLPRISLEALAGATSVESDDFATRDGEELETGDALVRLRYTATETVTFWADYSRMITWSGPPDPFQTVNRWILLGEWKATQELSFRGRLQYDHVDTALGAERVFWSASFSGGYMFGTERVTIDLGVTWRGGDTRGVPGDNDFDDLILHLGIIATSY
jgi:hypothetical protein